MKSINTSIIKYNHEVELFSTIDINLSIFDEKTKPTEELNNNIRI